MKSKRKIEEIKHLRTYSKCNEIIGHAPRRRAEPQKPFDALVPHMARYLCLLLYIGV